MKNKILLGMGLAASVVSLQGQEDIIGETRNTLDNWVETQQIISETKSDWELEKSILTDSESLLSSELERLTTALAELEDTSTAADQERIDLAAEREDLSLASAVVAGKIGALETQMKEIIKTFPEPLITTIEPLISRMPKDPNNTKLSLGERVQNIVGILSQADKFNGTIKLTSESREVGEGRVVEVRTLYWGLGGAFYVDASGDYAGVGHPGKDGWEWPQVEGAGDAIKTLVEIYEGTGEIQFVDVPASIK